MASKYTIIIDDSYVVPQGILTKEQYINFVMNMAAESYKNSYKALDKEAGIEAALAIYNTALIENLELMD